LAHADAHEGEPMKNSSTDFRTASAKVHSFYRGGGMKNANGIAHPAEDEVSRWLGEGGSPAPEPERADERAMLERSARTSLVIAAALAVGALVGILGYVRFARPSTASAR
jgi:hypothetical protein